MDERVLSVDQVERYLRGLVYEGQAKDWRYPILLEHDAALRALIGELAGAIKAVANDLDEWRAAKVCTYMGLTCDCKYGGPNQARIGTEQTGCPELRTFVGTLRAALARVQEAPIGGKGQ